MKNLLRSLIANTLFILACSGREEAPASSQKAALAGSGPEIVFYVPSLVETARARFTGTSEWSANDDQDTIFVVLRGAPGENVSIGLSIDAVVRRVSLADELKDAAPQDTIGRQVEWQKLTQLKTDSLARLADGILLRVLKPSGIDGQVLGTNAKDQQVVALKVKVSLPSGSQVTGTVKLLPSV